MATVASPGAPLPSPLLYSPAVRSSYAPLTAESPTAIATPSFAAGSFVGSFTSYFDAMPSPLVRAQGIPAFPSSASSSPLTSAYSPSLSSSSPPLVALPVAAIVGDEPAPLSFQQAAVVRAGRRLPHLVVAASIRLHDGAFFELSRLQASASLLLARHPMLRAAFDLASDALDAATYFVHPPHSEWVAAAHSCLVEECDRRDELARLAFRGDLHPPSAAPLFRVVYCRDTRDDAAWTVAIVASRLVADELSGLILLRHLLEGYMLTEIQHARLIARVHASSRDVDLEYPRYATHLAGYLDSDRGKALFSNWYEALGAGAHLLPPLELTREQTHNAQPLPPPATFLIPRATVRALDRASRSLGVDLKALALAAYALVLSRYAGGQEELVVSTVFSGRARRSRAAFTVGAFANSVPVLLTVPDGDATLTTFVAAVRDALVFASEHQEYPADLLRDKLAALGIVQRGETETNAAFAFVRAHGRATAPPLVLTGVCGPESEWEPGPGVTVTGSDLAAPFPLSLHAALVGLVLAEAPDGSLGGAVHCAEASLASDTVARLATHFVRVLESLATAAQPGTLDLTSISLLTDAEVNHIVGKLAVAPPHHQAALLQPTELGEYASLAASSVEAMFEAAVARVPDALALAFYAETDVSNTPSASCTYAQLNAAANILARKLVDLGVGPDVCVAVMIPRSIDMVVAVLAVLKARGAYVPLDPQYPASRLAYMLKTSCAPVALVSDATASRFLEPDMADAAASMAGIIQLPLEPEPETSDSTCAANLELTPRSPDSLAYVIFTSGSTGLPKGVAMVSGVLSNLIAWQHITLGAHPAVTLQFASLSFDVHFQELFSALSTGGSLVLVPEMVRKDFEMLLAVMETARVERALAEMALETRLLPRALSQVITAGEQLLCTRAVRALFAGLGPKSSLHNHYGPSETHVVTAAVLDGDPAAWPALPSIGFPIAKARCYIVDASGAVVPPGVPGELLIGGDVLARGYLHAPDLTAAAFVPDTLTPAAPLGARLYHTGDMVRQLASGELEYLARKSAMVKIRGHRVEVGEVEVVLGTHPAIQSAVVVAQDAPGSTSSSPASRILVAYLVAAALSGSGGDPAVTPADLVDHVAASLPSYMVPSAFVFMDHFPLTPSGKVARKALPPPTHDALIEHASHGGNAGQGPRADSTGALARLSPRAPGSFASDSESLVAAIFADMLALPMTSLSATTSFFDLGGHSLTATRLVSRLRREFGLVHYPLSAFYNAPTIAGLMLLSYNQNALWFLDQIASGAGADSTPGKLLTAAYSITFAMEIEAPGVFELDAFELALYDVLDAHPQLRTAYAGNAPRSRNVNELRKAAHDAGIPLFSRVQASSASAARAALDSLAFLPFDLGSGRLLACRAVSCPGPRLWLGFAVHHIAVDLWSLVLIVSQLAARYGTHKSKPAPVAPQLIGVGLAQPGKPYHAFATHQAAILAGVEGSRLEGFWKRKLDGVEALDLPTDYVRPASASHAGGLVRTHLSADVTAALASLASDCSATEYVVLLALFKALLVRVTHQTDVTVGSPMAGRSEPGFEDTVGYFINMVPIRDVVQPKSTSLYRLVDQVKISVLEALDHQDFPFSEMVAKCMDSSARDSSRSPIFQAAFVLQKTQIEHNALGALLLGEGGPGTRVDFGPFAATGCEMPRHAAMFDLTLVAARLADGRTALSLEYNADVFAPARMERMLDWFVHLASSWIAEPGTVLASAQVAPPVEIETVMHAFQPERLDLDDRHSLLDVLVRHAAELPPETVAVDEAGRTQVGSSPPRRLTFAGLEGASARVASMLLDVPGVDHDTVVGVCMHRSIDSLVAMVGIMRAGLAYMPMDYHYPVHRLEYMLADSRAPICLFHAETSELVASLDRAVMPHCSHWLEIDGCVGAEDYDPARPGVLAPASSGFSSASLAYVIYTSGTTGNPKGVCIEVSSLNNLVVHMLETYALSAADRATMSCGVGFDACVIEMWPILYAGGSLWPVDDSKRLDVLELMTFISTHSLTCCLAPTPLMEAMFRERDACCALPLRYIFTGGDVVHTRPDPAAAFKVINLYGPTENTVISAVAHITPEDPVALEWSCAAGPLPPRTLLPPPIGFPVTNQVVYVLDELMAPVPLGVWGELYVGGLGVARGYLNLPEKTAASFVANPFSSATWAPRLYKTGDVVRFDEHGELWYAARKDHQVKIRGFRIELGEIETVLASVEAVSEAAVVVSDNSALGKHLVAFVVAAGGTDVHVSARSLRVALGASLPEYMVPKRFVVWGLASLPTTANGKTDRRRLVQWLDEAGGEERVSLVDEPEDGTGTVLDDAPVTETQDIVADIWKEVLGVTKVGISCDFFEFGGHSLAAAQVASRARVAFGVEISVSAVFENPTIAGFASYLEARAKAGVGGEVCDRDHVPLAPVGESALGADDWLHEPHPVSLNQASLWYAYLLNPSDTTYNVSFVAKAGNRLDVARLQRAMALLVQLHPGLATRYQTAAGGQVPLMYYDPDFGFGFEVLAASDSPSAEKLLRDAVEACIALETGPLTSMTVVNDGADFWLAFVTHHICCDLWSMVVLLEDLGRMYDLAENSGPDSGFVALGLAAERAEALQLHTYNRWQAARLSTAEGHQLEAYWTQQLAGRLPALTLPEDHPRPAKLSSAGATYAFELDGATTAALRELNAAEGTTMFMTLLALYTLLLHRAAGQDEVVVGTLMACRSRIELERLVGFLANPVALRSTCRRGESFEDVLRRVRVATLGALAHADYPFTLVLESVAPERETSRSPVFQALFVFERPHGKLAKELDAFVMGVGGHSLSLGSSLTLESVPLAERTAPYEIQLVVSEADDGIRAFFQYNTEIFAEATISSLAGGFAALVQAALAEPSAEAAAMPVLTADEEAQLLTETHQDVMFDESPPTCVLVAAGDDESDDADGDGSGERRAAVGVHELVEARAAETPDAVAVVDGSGTSMTYAELNAWANRIARILRASGVFVGSVVGLVLPRSLELVVGMLAVWKAGGAYVPVDPTFPDGRIAFMLENSAPVCVLYRGELPELSPPAPGTKRHVLSFDDDARLGRGGESLGVSSARLVRAPAGPSAVANVIYTSGTSGTPKGICVPHGCLLNMIGWWLRAYEMGPGDVSGHMLGVSFDPVFCEIWPALCCGAEVAIVPESSRLEPRALLQWWVDAQVTVQAMATPMTEAVLREPPPAGLALRVINTGGDKLKMVLPEAWQAMYGDQLALYNMYGPTETTVGCTVGRVHGDVRPPPIGKPIANTFAYVTDERGTLVRRGMRGQLLVGGAGVTRGYLGLPEKTASVFEDDRWWRSVAESLGLKVASGLYGDGRMYATGDVVRWRGDGSLACLGRIDAQVKIRGFRIELAEIEVVLREAPGVADAAVVAMACGAGSAAEKMLVAYVAPQRATQLLRQELYTHAAAKLAEYMVPRAIVVLSGPLPLTANGKVDVRALPAPTAEDAAGVGASGVDHTPPRTEVEAELAAAWAQVLGLASVGIHANFFELGGYSLLAAQLVGIIEARLGVRIGMREVFEAPTVSALANVVARATGVAEADESVVKIDLAGEVVLPSEICAPASGEVPRASGAGSFLAPPVVFLTGATGFVGSFLLAELLANTRAEVKCLVRASDEASGRARLDVGASKFGLPPPAATYGERVRVVVGELGPHMFGLTSDAFSVLARSVDVIIHNGAGVNFVYPYSALKGPNVIGTQEVLRLACFGAIGGDAATPVHFISTLSTLDTDARVISETDVFPRWERLVSGYSQSKWVGEQIVALARCERGVPASIYRLGRIAPHSQTGAGSHDDLLTRVLKGCVETKFVPSELETLVDFTPVDYASKAVVELALSGRGLGRDFHILNPSPMPLTRLWKLLRRAKYKLYPSSYDGWFRTLLEHARRSDDGVLLPVLLFFEESGDISGLAGELPPPELYPKFEVPNSKELISARCPPVSKQLVDAYVAAWVAEGFFPSPGAEERSALPAAPAPGGDGGHGKVKQKHKFRLGLGKQ
ncbi:amino acid adenylation domain-containing protein [Thecamonas trahens ATCC 50062]|uniref:Amino acid adenylation domain-containing protein n=1 Tax=Thecamonas trahens ATCC 50062 TaxID=461836 RepID=A0A0L0DG55_THETB|nr:amino acid adenylation domain-containing protein [Thecamonas trahens ATCC 50062]KNC51165.1 amino acid adenylation domain-containing protein [Thecamonas trahens ATCC 50062]|eukprot:XP_013756367.1 amino acid adenylation domain-containing protein [Thecamonas trahens ATCC 50062]